MPEFVTQQVHSIKRNTPVTVTAQTTSCPYLVITPSVGTDEDGNAYLCSGLTLTHTLTGYAIAQNQTRANQLQDLASRLSVLDWTFTDPAKFVGENRARGAELVREWRMAEVSTEPVRFPGDTEDEIADRQSDPAGSFLREHLQWWMKHSEAMMDKAKSGLPTFEDNPKAYMAEISTSCEGFGLIYMLAVLRAIDPKVADVAARFLNVQYECGDSLGEWVWQWNDELAAGKPLRLVGIPDLDPLAAFGQ